MQRNDVTYPSGFSAYGLSCGIKKNGNADLGILISEKPAQIFGALTQNAVKAAPVLYCQQVLDSGKKVSHILVNSGNANACTGDRGFQDVLAEVTAVRELGKAQGEIMVSSTGVIGEYLPMEKLQTGIQKLFAEPQPTSPFIAAIMTTDTFEKKAQASLMLDGVEIRLGGVAKGAGMIRPNMATMLSYITTDLDLAASYRPQFMEAVQKSFNSISVDGDMSTNDTVLLLANGDAGKSYSDLSSDSKKTFDLALQTLMQDLAKNIIRDGEGATKLVTIDIEGAASIQDAQNICRAIANSPLVKTAFFGGDANWGRVLAAAGSCGVPLAPEKLVLEFCGVRVLEQGRAAKYSEDEVAERMKAKDVFVKMNLGMGAAKWTYWTCDFSYDYVKINAAYRT